MQSVRYKLKLNLRNPRPVSEGVIDTREKQLLTFSSSSDEDDDEASAEELTSELSASSQEDDVTTIPTEENTTETPPPSDDPPAKSPNLPSPNQKLFFMTLPMEIIIETISHLPYGDLKKRIPLVSRFFHSLLQKDTPVFATDIDVTLWRDAPKPGIHMVGRQQCTIHPLLKFVRRGSYRISYRYHEDINTVKLRRNIFQEDEPFVDKLIDTPLRLENACQPAVAKAEYHRVRFDTRKAGGGVDIVGTGDGGRVTVLDIMQGVCGACKVEKWGKNYGGYFWDGVEDAEIIDGCLHLYDMPH